VGLGSVSATTKAKQNDIFVAGGFAPLAGGR
jgi:hypothetical protein